MRKASLALGIGVALMGFVGAAGADNVPLPRPAPLPKTGLAAATDSAPRPPAAIPGAEVPARPLASAVPTATEQMREAAVIGKQHEIKGQTICAFVSLKAGIQNSPPLVDELKGHVAKKIGPIARPWRNPFCRRICPRRARGRSCAACLPRSPIVAMWAT